MRSLRFRNHPDMALCFSSNVQCLATCVASSPLCIPASSAVIEALRNACSLMLL